jgi:Putative Flp pilus-assembly TadE/G-like
MRFRASDIVFIVEAPIRAGYLMSAAICGAIRIAASALSAFRLLARLCRDEAGSQIIMIALLMPVFLGVAALAVDGGFWGYGHLNLQAAADSAAVSAARVTNHIGFTPADYQTEAKAVAATYGFVDGVNSVTITARLSPATSTCSPVPSSDPWIGNSAAMEAIVSQPQSSFFSAVFGYASISICARAVALANSGGSCMEALGGGGINLQDSNIQINMAGCGLYSNSNISLNKSNQQINITNGGTVGAVGTVSTGSPSNSINPPGTDGLTPVSDPYASVTPSFTNPITTCTSNCNQPQLLSCSFSPCTIPPGGYPFGLTLGQYSCLDKKGKPTTCNVSGGGGQFIYNLQSNSTYWFGNDLAFANSNLTLNGSGTSVYLNSGSVQMQSASGIINLTGGSLALGGPSAQVNMQGSGDQINISGGALILTGATSSINVANKASSNAITVSPPSSGTDSGIAIAANAINVLGDSAQITVTAGTIYLPGTSSSITMTGNKDGLTISAPTAGWNAGFGIWERNTTAPNTIGGTQGGNQATLDVNGIIYMPNANLTYQGNAGSVKADCTQFITSSLTLGGSNLNITALNCGAFGIPGPPNASAVLVE